MICPKCGKRMCGFVGTSQVSQLSRQDSVCVSAVRGFNCWNCGTWVDDCIEPLIPMPELERKEAVVPGPRYNEAVKSPAFALVERFFESMLAQRQAGASWHTVAKLMAQAGQYCQEKTLQKYFLLEQRRRCEDGQAEKT
ncbi:MAG: hypothetical protein ACOYL3_07190 [Desulfuromonadaceae bacterium]